MTKLSPAKYMQLILLIVGTGVVAGVLWQMLIRPRLKSLRQKKVLIAQTLEKTKTAQHNTELISRYRGDQRIADRALARLESRMAAGDAYRWIIRTFSQEQKFPNVELSNFDPPRISDAAPQSALPYRVAFFSIVGQASYHDVGKYVANLENSFPNLKIQKMEMEPANPGDTTSDDAEKLNFRFEVTLPVKPTTN